MDMSKLTAEQRLHRTHVALMAHKKFILMSGVLVSGDVTVKDSGVKTARTDGLNVEYSREFISKLSDKELAFLVLHENWHKAYKHLLIWKDLHDIDAKVANQACDYVINLQIKRYDPNGEICVMPEGGLMDERFDGMDTRQVFDILMKEKEEGGGGEDGEGGDGGESGEGDGEFDEHDWEEAKSWDADKIKEVEKKIDQALRQGEVLLKKKGDAGANGDRAFGELLTPKIDPYALLREYMISTCSNRSDSSWRRPSRRFISQDIYMPTQIAEALENVVIAIDTSGSISERELKRFLTETAHVCNVVSPQKVHVLYWGTDVCQHEVYEQDRVLEIADSTKPIGGGGTDPVCVARYMKNHNVTSQVMIVLTDGYIGKVSAAEWQGMPPTVWLVDGAKSVDVVGKVIYL